MSIESVGFTPWDVLDANSSLRVTLSDGAFDLLNKFPQVVVGVYQSLWPVARIIPTSRLATVSGDRAAVIDANLKEETTGAVLLNRLQSVGTRFAFVSKVELLSETSRRDSGTSDGAAERAAAQTGATIASQESGFLHQLGTHLSGLAGTAKWVAIGVGVLVLLYLLHSRE